LSKHNCFCFNTANTPTCDSKTVDHGCVGVSSNDWVGVEETLVIKDNTSQVLQVNLMDNTRAWRDNFEVVESFGTPL
jgi:hypothetical protein